jgi:predicted FMN-binding regulatory protein PaiB
MHTLIRARPFATLATAGAAGLYASHLPTVLKDNGACGVIECHLARANPHCNDLAEGSEALMIFQGPKGYITPNWYPSKALHGKVVPTWNFAVVHAYGRPEAMQEKDWLLRHVTQLTAPAREGRNQTVGAVGCARRLHRGLVARHRRFPHCYHAARGQVEDEPKSRGARSDRRR